MKTWNTRVLIGVFAVTAGLFALSQCVTVVDRKPVVQVKEKDKDKNKDKDKKRPPAPAYRVGVTVVVTGVVQARGNTFLIDDDASDFLFQFAGVRFDEKAALQRALGKRVSIQLKITGQQGAKIFIADFMKVNG